MSGKAVTQCPLESLTEYVGYMISMVYHIVPMRRVFPTITSLIQL